MTKRTRNLLSGLAIIAAMLFLGGLTTCAHAQAPGLPTVPLGYCQLAAVNASTGLASCSGGIPAAANAILVKADTQALRYRPDGATTAPTATVGMPIATTDAPLYIQGGALANYRFIAQNAGGNLNVIFLQAPQ